MWDVLDHPARVMTTLYNVDQKLGYEVRLLLDFILHESHGQCVRVGIPSGDGPVDEMSGVH